MGAHRWSALSARLWWRLVAFTPESALLPPRPIVGPYRADRLVGIGAEGATWQATGPHGLVALKVARDDRSRALVDQEATLLTTLPHPHLVRLESSGRGWMVTELVDGTPVHRWAEGRSADLVVRAFLEVLGALQHLHAHGALHGDLKPAHILVDPWGHTKLLDLGTPADGHGRGTPGFTAPEVLAGAPHSPEADRYAFGACLYAALTGRPPHHSADPSAVFAMPGLASPVPASAWRVDVPDRVDRLLQRLLLPDPATRPHLEEVAKVLVKAWSSPARRPVLGMSRARAALHRAVRRAQQGEPIVVMIHGPQGSGRRTLTHEAVRQAQLEGLEVVPRYDPADLLKLARGGRIPVAATRGSTPGIDDVTAALTAAGCGALLLIHGPAPSASLRQAGATVLSPDGLTLRDAYALGAWLGVTRAEAVPIAWRRSQGLPRALWIALEPYANAHTDDRAPFSLPGAAARIVQTLREGHGALTIEDLAKASRLPMHALADHIGLLEATGRVRTDQDGWLVRLIAQDGA